MHNKRKGITIIIVVVIVICAFSFLGVGYILLKKKESPNIEFSSVNDDNNILSGEKQTEIINNLIIYGIEIYNNGQYKNLEKSNRGYFITLGQLKERGYNVNNLVRNCLENDPIIFFDVDHADEYKDYPILVVHDCSPKVKGN